MQSRPLLLIFGLLVPTLIGCGEEAPELELIIHAPAFESGASFGGTERCEACHYDTVQDWSQTGMARSLQAVVSGELSGLGLVEDGPSGYSYQYSTATDGKAYVLGETRKDTPSHALGSEVLYAIGSGERDRSYVVGHGAGLWFSPIEVLSTERGRHATLAPGASMVSGGRLSFAISEECLGCHTDAPPPRSFPLNLRPDPAHWQPRGISCAACHGGTIAHADWREAQNSVDKDPILQIANLSRVEQLSICAACHLQGDARLVLNNVDLGPPKPGTDLLKQRALFVAATPTADVGFVSQVERLVLSECFLESQMTCATCHDPHRTLHAERERKRVRDACTLCHASDSPNGLQHFGNKVSAAGCSRMGSHGIETHAVQLDRTLKADCVDCHMPLTGVFDVAEITIHDHYIRRDVSDAKGATPEGNLRFPESASGDWRRFKWPGEKAPDHIDEPGLWMMAFVNGEHLTRAIALIDEAPGEVAIELAMYHHTRASLLQSLGRDEDARAAYERALELDPKLAESAINLGLLYGNTGDLERGIALLSKVIESYPLADGALRNRAVLLYRSGDLAGFARDLERAFSAWPSANLAGKLSGYFASIGDHDKANRYSRMLRELDPLAGKSKP
ncbi:MAG: hypothetical protein ACI8X5_001783 [Planctomycetota bacterium]|jgi:hypothetical protein